MRKTPLLALLLVVPLAVWAGCGAEAQNQGGSGDDDDSGGAGGAGGEGGEGGAASNCAVDCSTVQTPQCQQAVCNETTGQCDIQPSEMGAICDDGQFCTTADFCEAGLCKGGGMNTCNLPVDSCTSVVCNEASDSCSTTPANDGAFCVIPEGDLCVTNTKCQNGICTGTQKDCFFAPGGECNTVTCNPMNGECEPTPNPGKDGQPCSSSGDLCLTGKTCNNGICSGGSPKDCSAFTKDCNNGVCNIATGQCEPEPIPPGGSCLDAADECNDGICDVNGFCQPVPLPGSTCASKTDDCNQGICDMGGLCQSTPANDAAACNDGNSCTLGEFCTAGVCGGGMMGQYVAYFTESFASNAAGWVLGNEWQIGPAMASSCPSGDDPAMDNTMTADNGVAGVVIGGCASTSIHPFQYIESPAVDVSQAVGAVYLEYYRWLTSDYLPYMQNTVDVWNGSAWINVWQTGNFPGVEDTVWTHMSHDITAHKNAALKVRFGMNVGSGGVFTIGSWNVDDVAIANLVCNP